MKGYKNPETSLFFFCTHSEVFCMLPAPAARARPVAVRVYIRGDEKWRMSVLVALEH